MKRVAASLLWFYAAWTAGALVDYVGGLLAVPIGPGLGLLLGTVAAALIAFDPRHVIWTGSGGAITVPSASTAQPI